MAGAAAHNSGFIAISNLFVFVSEFDLAIPREPSGWVNRVQVAGLSLWNLERASFPSSLPAKGRSRRRGDALFTFCKAHMQPSPLSLSRCDLGSDVGAVTCRGECPATTHLVRIFRVRAWACLRFLFIESPLGLLLGRNILLPELRGRRSLLRAQVHKSPD